MRIVGSAASNYFAMVYGDSGTGKTHFAATLGELGRVLVIDPDQGYKTIENAPDLAGNEKIQKNVMISSFDKFSDLNEAYELISKNDPKEWTRVFDVEVTHPFDWVVWDTWSEIQWYMLQELRKNEKLESGHGGKDIEFRKNLGIQHWGMMTDLNKLAIEQLKRVTKKGIINQLFVMQEKIDKDENTGTIIKGPAIHGKMIKEILAYFDINMHTFVTPTGDWWATTKPKAGWPAKTRLGVGKEYKNPTAKQVFELG